MATLFAMFSQIMADLLVNAQDASTIEIMPWVADRNYCLECHEAGEWGGPSEDRYRVCTTHCMTCHTNMERHHEVGVTVPVEDLPAELRLNSREELACITCHDLTRPRFDDKPWKCASLFGRIFGRASRHKTYYLTVRNNSGQLCKICH